MDSKSTKKLPSYIGGVFAVITGLFFIFFPEISSGVIGLLFGVVLYVILQIYPSFAFFPSFLDFCAWLVVKFYRFWLNEK